MQTKTVPSTVTMLSVVMIFIIALPPFVSPKYPPPFHFEEWIDNVERINSDFPANDTVVYARIEPGWFMPSMFSHGMEIHTIDELLMLSPVYYTTTKKYTLICVDKYNYSRYANLPSKYFHDDYYRMPEVYRWLHEYRQFHGNSSVSLYIDGKYTAVYLIKRSDIDMPGYRGYSPV